MLGFKLLSVNKIDPDDQYNDGLPTSPPMPIFKYDVDI